MVYIFNICEFDSIAWKIEYFRQLKSNKILLEMSMGNHLTNRK